MLEKRGKQLRRNIYRLIRSVIHIIERRYPIYLSIDGCSQLQLREILDPPPLHPTITDKYISVPPRFDNDMYSHLNNTVYAVLFDSIVNSWLIAECGMDPFHKANSSGSDVSKQVGIMVNSYCDYFSSVSYPDVLDLGLRVAKLGSSSVTYEVGVFKQGERDVKVVGGYTHVFCARETMRPTKAGMEERVRRGLEKLIVRKKRGGSSNL